MKPECVIFDLDGTLWDAIDTCVNAWNSVLAEKKYSDLGQVSRNDFLASMGKNHSEIRQIYFTSLPLEERELLLLECYSREIPSIYKFPPHLYAGVQSGLLELKKDYRLGLVSNCQSAYLKAFLDCFGLNNLFDAMLCYGDSKRTKGENILEVIAKLSVSSAVYVGDTEGDQKAAEFAGIPFYFASYGFGRTEKYDGRFNDFSAIVSHLTSL
jgi:phosphoglycolate phosphatase